MASLHSALQVLGPTPFSSLPTEDVQANGYLQNIFAKAQLIIDSVPLPPQEDLTAGTRARSNTTTSAASNVSEISASSVRSDPIDASNSSLQKEWGKPIKLAAKDNPLGIAVYKLGGKDGKGAWFARRSVHEGLSFRRWKLGLEHEFPESLAVQGGPGEGNVRGIGGERRVEQKEIKGVGKVEVYHLSAQFPGPTTPRDFVTLLMTSDSALGCSEKQKLPPFSDYPKHFMVVSKPCIHPECPPRDGFIRGQYESIEFIRELHRKPRRSASAADLLKAGSEAHKEGETYVDRSLSSESKEQQGVDVRRRSQTISFADPRAAKNEGKPVDTTSGDSDTDTETDPVEWIMITRSDPGGSVPRFMVERGTPGSIVADASKFLDWACKKDHDVPATQTEGATSSDLNASATEDLESIPTNGDLAGLSGPATTNDTPPSSSQETALESTGLVATMTSFAKAGVESYAPQALVDRLHADQPALPTERDASTLTEIEEADDTTTLSSMSFASAEEGIEDDASVKSSSSIRHPDSPDQSRHEKELARLHERKRALDEKLAKSREKELKDKEELTSKEQDRLRKAEEKHKREIEKQEQKYKKEIAKLEAKRMKETAKEEARRRKEQDKDEKTRLMREKEELKQELEVTKQEREIFRDQVGALQRENTSLVARLGKLSDGRSVLKEVQAEVASGTRSRSSSLRRSKETTGSEVEGTVLAGAKAESPLK
ncbi:hypothetical protein G7Y79_00004g013880 [Physcia stellaris]|nr:hypothetical protein G7Y79_00004g013880 [Physcia stellaris]